MGTRVTGEEGGLGEMSVIVFFWQGAEGAEGAGASWELVGRGTRVGWTR